MIHPPPPAPPHPLRLCYDSHLLPELNYRGGPSESSITLPPSSGYHQTSIWAETSAWLHWRAPAQQFLWDYAHLIAHSNSHAAGFDGTFCRKSFPILKCLSVYKWWRRVDLVESSAIPQAGHYKCWLDEGWVEYLITTEPLVLVSHNCKKSCGLSGRERGNERGKFTNKMTWRGALIIWPKVTTCQAGLSPCLTITADKQGSM